MEEKKIKMKKSLENRLSKKVNIITDNNKEKEKKEKKEKVTINWCNMYAYCLQI